MVLLVKTGLKTNVEVDKEQENKLLSIPLSSLYIILGAVAIVFGGDLTVDAASKIAMDFGMSKTLVGLTIVSIGTSLPELVTSIVAARKNEVDMALGNAIGSNIFNILLVLGLSSAISPIIVVTEGIMDSMILFVFTCIIWIFSMTKKSFK
ncbi:Inner membrane protein YrbG, predicted calcium/sodium:proton antiporter [Lachnospiraceae bacterium TWA4]|nr:Inner membrane protein YrbG, predicted calcium/sodium:proton antiporter [Lachnospiraceae bacterium TWA4]